MKSAATPLFTLTLATLVAACASSSSTTTTTPLAHALRRGGQRSAEP
jgi:hypothetical protein